MKNFPKFLLSLFLVFSLHITQYTLHNLYAAVPHLINYQGRLTDTSGVPLNGSYSITFRIYDAETTGTMLWEETQASVVVQKGIFSVLLGSVTNLGLAFDIPYFLEIKVGTEVMTPRQRITSAGYAITAENAEKAKAPVVDLDVANKKYVDDNATKIIQIVNTQTDAVATGTTQIPNDDTIPQNTEGTQFMSLAITPTSATNKLKIDVVVNIANEENMDVIVALFQDDTANALAAVAQYTAYGNHPHVVNFTHYMTTGTTSTTIFKVRIGAGFGSWTTTFNGISGVGYLGGVCVSSITITEIRG